MGVEGGGHAGHGEPGWSALRTAWGPLAWPQGPARVGLPSPTSPKPRPGHSPDRPGSRTLGSAVRPLGEPGSGSRLRERDAHYPVGIQEGARDGKPGYFRGWEEAGGGRGQENHFHKRESAGAPG